MNKLNIIEKLFETLSKISQGKYSKEEFSTILQPNQELSLRTQALESLNIFLKELFLDIEKETFLEKSLERNPLGFENPMISISSSDNFMDLMNISMENENFFEKSKAMKQEIAKSIIKFNNNKPIFSL